MAYTPIRISTVSPSKAITFSIYIFFKEKFICYGKPGTNLEGDLIKKLKKQKVAKFFVMDTEEEVYQQYIDNLLSEVIEDASISTENKAEMVEGASSTAIDGMAQNPASEIAYKLTTSAAGNIVKLILNDPNALKAMYNHVAEDNDLLIKHSINVAAIACKVAKRRNLSDEEITNITVAALLHDLALPEIENGIESFKKKVGELDKEKNLAYRAHPKKTAEMVSKNPSIPKSVVDLILAHEEKTGGAGYPNKKQKLTPAEEILALSNSYDKRVTVLKMNAKDAMKDINIEELGAYDLELIKEFKEFLKAEGLL